MTNSPSKPARDTGEEALRSKATQALQRLKQDKLSWPVWLAIGYAGVVLPVLCHLATTSDPPRTPRWQSGDLDDQLGFVLSGLAGFVLYPLMAYPILSLSLLLFREERFAHNYVVRFGIATALPVAAWYGVLYGLVLFGIAEWHSVAWLDALVFWGFGIATPFLFWVVLRALLWVRHKLWIPWIVIILLFTIGSFVGTIYAIVTEGAEGIIVLPAVALFFTMFFGPYWCFDAYLVMGLRLVCRYPQRVRFTIAQLMAAMTWLAAFLAACRWSVILSLEEYSKLPLEPPSNCYIATAASQGHTRFVGSQTIRSASGTRWQVNRQLAVLKAAELALRTLLPTFHTWLRAVYDRLGPVVARRLRHPILADLAYVGLKPFEWNAILVLIGLLGEGRHCIDRLYLRDGERINL
ncbi:MAG: hypothetical protein CMJ64_17235 [Planctomycetaceae bacterium]|nr:hypothetical protein [Planctomycetaceae bacterium]